VAGLVLRVKGSEAWSYDTICALCKCTIGPDQDVYVVGAHVLHAECLEWLLRQPEHKFREVLGRLPLDMHEELEEQRKLHHGAPAPVERVLASPPEKPPKLEDRVKRFKGKLWVVFHAVEERDWERLKHPEFQKTLEELKKEAEELKDVHPNIPRLVENLVDWDIKYENERAALLDICRVLFLLDPPVEGKFR
jgi:hypothetical protein